MQRVVHGMSELRDDEPCMCGTAFSCLASRHENRFPLLRADLLSLTLSAPTDPHVVVPVDLDWVCPDVPEEDQR